MQINDIVAALDSEILRLEQVKALLSGSTTNGKAPIHAEEASSFSGSTCQDSRSTEKALGEGKEGR